MFKVLWTKELGEGRFAGEARTDIGVMPCASPHIFEIDLQKYRIIEY